jgi:large subunit ribosomal protein L25
MFTIDAKTREAGKGTREEGVIPAVFYGGKLPSTPISINLKEFKKIWKEAGESSAIKLVVDGEKIDALIHDVQLDPVAGSAVHVDFLVIDINKPIQVALPIEFTGEAQAVKSGVGVLVKVMLEIEVEALPRNLPHALEVDISNLENVNDQITVNDIKFPEGVKPMAGEEEVVVLIGALEEEKEEEAAQIDLSSIEVEKKGKKEEEEGAEA